MSRKQSAAQAQPILAFEGYYSFLSNDYPAWVHYEGLAYPSISTAFQAARTDDHKIRLKISGVTDTQQFREIAMSISNPDDWTERRDHIMEMLVRDKFKRNKEILEKLMATKDKKLVNSMKSAGSSQLHWGVYQGEGKNVLGKILMSIREEFNKGNDTKNWIQQNLSLQTDANMFPILTMAVLKDGKKIQKLDFSKNKSYYLFGSLKTIDFHLQNPTISRNHACIYFSDLEVMMVDLKSTHGTFVKRKGHDQKIQLEGLVPCKLFKEDIVQFGTSAREYIIDIDRSSIEKYIAEQQADLNGNGKNISQKFSNPEQYSKLSKQDVKSLLGMESQCLLVERLAKTDNYQKLKEYFGKFGKITNVRMKINQRSGRIEDKALIYFDSPGAVGQVLSKKKQLEYKVSSVAQSQAEQLLSTDHPKKPERRSRSRSKERREEKSRRPSTSRSRSREKNKKSKHAKH